LGKDNFLVETIKINWGQKKKSDICTMKILDTFAGAGGFSLGFAQTSHFSIIGAIEIDQWAADTFQSNHYNSNVLVGDIQQYSKEFLLNTFSEKPDIILGGPPCQGYSIANKKAGDPTDPRNTLFKEFLRLGAIFEPSLMIMENVPNLTKIRTKDKVLVTDIIVKALEDMGYFTYHTILNATDFGVPQIRKRWVVIASKVPLTQPFPTPTHALSEIHNTLFINDLQPTPNLWDAISDLPQIAACEGAERMPYDLAPKTNFQKMIRGKSDQVYNHVAMKHSRRMIERFAAMQCGDSVADVPEALRPMKRNGNGAISTQLYDQTNRKMYPDRPCHTIAASFYANFVHPFLNRNFTPREGARIQTFPDDYVFKGKPTVVSHKLLQREGREAEKHLCQYNQIGNAVPPLLAKAIAQNLITQLALKPLQSC
jgi:DNA (cytosine-5)-methyltransferase 1